MGVTLLHGTPVYLLTQSLARSLKHIYTHVHEVYASVYGLIIAPVQLKKEA